MSNDITTLFQSVVNSVSEPVVFSALTQQAKAEANQSPVLDVEFVLDGALRQRIEQSVKVFAESEDLLADSKSLIRRAVMAINTDLTEEGQPSFAYWEGYATAWQKQYMGYRDVTEKRSQDAWYEVCRYLKNDHKLEKPAKPTKDGNRMSEKRKAEQEKLKAMVDSVLVDNIKTAVGVGDFTTAKKLQDEQKRRNKIANADAEVLRKAEVEFIYKCMKMLTDDKLIAEIKTKIPSSVIKAVLAKL